MGIGAILLLISNLLPQIEDGVEEAVPLLQKLSGLVANLFHGKDPTPEEIQAVQAARKLVVAAVNRG